MVDNFVKTLNLLLLTYSHIMPVNSVRTSLAKSIAGNANLIANEAKKTGS